MKSVMRINSRMFVAKGVSRRRHSLKKKRDIAGRRKGTEGDVNDSRRRKVTAMLQEERHRILGRRETQWGERWAQTAGELLPM